MRHRKRGRRLGRSSSHRRAMLRNLASSLFLTEREVSDLDQNAPAVKGRVVTTVQKAKEVQPLVEKCITLARRALPHADAAEQFRSGAKRRSDDWNKWRSSADWQQWCAAQAPVVAARRRALQLLGDKQAVAVLFDEVAPRFADRDGGYTRILKLAHPRLGDGGARAILEFVGVNDRETLVSQRPAFSDDEYEAAPPDDETESVTAEPPARELSDETPSDDEAASTESPSDEAKNN